MVGGLPSVKGNWVKRFGVPPKVRRTGDLGQEGADVRCVGANKGGTAGIISSLDCKRSKGRFYFVPAARPGPCVATQVRRKETAMGQKRNRVLALALAAALVLAMAGCAQKNSNTNTTNSNANTSTKKYKIGIIQPIEHPSLDTIYKGFQDGLKEQGYGDKVTLDFQNAQGDQSTMNTIAQRFISNKDDVVLAIATPAAQAMAAQTTTIPIVGAAVTSFTAAGLVKSDAAPGGNVTGVSDAAPVDAQVGLITNLVPTAKTVGFLYNSGEANSVAQVAQIKAALKAKGLATVDQTVTNTNDVQQATQALAQKCDIMYSPTDNTVASAMPTVSQVSNAAKIPIIVGADSMVSDGGLATAGVDYLQLGKNAATMAIKILEGSKPATMPIETMTKDYQIYINKKEADLFGITIPAVYKDAKLL